MKCYDKASYQCMGTFDPKNYSRCIEYLGINSQFRKPVSESIAFGGCNWVLKISGFVSQFIINFDQNSEFGYTLVVDDHYQVYLKLLHKDLPGLHEKIVVNGVVK